ncbi:hypothetical protein Rhopal_007068-T1 [Rhodotorula paludigena]|uniref:Uncharacterized protein n=1 Tax=Rhodotorula paludigena TaxID=86838 RepID=A0AAV5GWZ6_9BASI|nr:hypothetical protein Rhopal_007068-T1 [Rhodotorula paludigena]
MPSAVARPSRGIHKEKDAKALARKIAAAPSKPDPKMALLFREEVKSLLARTPALPASLALDPATTVIGVRASFERQSGSGFQESVQFCTGTDAQGRSEDWVVRTEGARSLFPRVAQSKTKKRFRAEDTESNLAVAADDEELDAVDQDHTPPRRKKHSSSSSSRRVSGLAAPKKKSRRPHRPESSDYYDAAGEDDGMTTETEASHLARTRNRSSRRDLVGQDDEDEDGDLGRGKRRCSGREAGAFASTSGSTSTAMRRSLSRGDDEPVIKAEGNETDDLSSLCGRVGGLEMRSTVEPDTDIDLPTTSKGKGKAAAH